MSTIPINTVRLSANQRRQVEDDARACALASGVSITAWRDWRKGHELQRDLSMLAAPEVEAQRIKDGRGGRDQAAE